MESIFDIKDKGVIVTGGAGILCGAMSIELARRGAKVFIVDYDISKANQLCEKIRAEGHFAIAAQADVTDKQQLEKALGSAVEAIGKIDVLINGAGGNKKEATTSEELLFFDLPAEAIQSVFDLNLLGTVLASQVFGKEMTKSDKGVILNISSMTALRPLTRIPAYSAAKAAVSNFTKWLAVHMCQNYSKDIRVNAIAPGFFLTEQNRFLLTDKETGKLTERGKTIIDHTPMGRFGEAEELIGTVLWLLSDAAKFVTGIVVPLDGGFSAFSGV